jgi:hypothetical protein
MENEPVGLIEYNQTVCFRLEIKTNLIPYRVLLTSQQSPVYLEGLLISLHKLLCLMNYVDVYYYSCHECDCCNSCTYSWLTLPPWYTPKLSLPFSQLANTILGHCKLPIVGSRIPCLWYKKTKQFTSWWSQVLAEFRISLTVCTAQFVDERLNRSCIHHIELAFVLLNEFDPFSQGSLNKLILASTDGFLVRLRSDTLY